MNRSRRYVSRALLFLSVSFAADVYAQTVERMDEVINAFVPDRFMGTVLVARGDEIVLNKSYGFANLEWNIPHTVDTKFRLGSVTKQFTAAAILLLEEEGKLSTDDLLSKHLDNVPEAWSKITVFHLLTHTAGLPNFTSLPAYLGSMPMPTTAEKTVKGIMDLPLDFAPGAEFRYSNSGYVALGLLIEKISGSSYERFLIDNIFTPLGMQNSGYDSYGKLLPMRATGYSPGPAGPINALYIDMSIPHGAGALYSTAGDLLRWNQALFGGKLLSDASLAKMTTPNLGDYAFGLTVTTEEGVKKISHGGAINGFNTSMTYYPAEDLTIIALSNINGPGADAIGNTLGQIAQGVAVVLPNERKEILVSEDILQRYVGSYALAPNFILTVTLENGQLITQATGQQKVPIFAETETRFFPKVVDAQIDFESNAAGEVTGLVLHQNGRDGRAPRQSGVTVAAPAQTEIQVGEEILQRYVGSYVLAPNFILTVTLENGQLITQATGQQKVPIFAETETRFFPKVVAAKIDFEMNAAGEVTGLILHQGGRDMPAPRQ